MIESAISTILNCDIQSVWKTVTALDDYSWRSDITLIESSDKSHFTEKSNDGILTHFTITVFEPCKQYTFDLDNKNLCGTWTGHFKQIDTRTEIRFIEMVTVKKWWLYPFAQWYLKKQQKQYISDLKLKCEQYG